MYADINIKQSESRISSVDQKKNLIFNEIMTTLVLFSPLRLFCFSFPSKEKDRLKPKKKEKKDPSALKEREV